MLTPLFLVDFKARQTPLAEEGEPHLERWLFLARPGFKRRSPSGWEWDIHGLAKRLVTNEEFRRPWGQGLYDYEEFGAGTGLTRRRGGWLRSASLGFQWSRRNYPNFFNPAPTQGKNLKIKDMGISRLSLGMEAGMFQVDYSLSLRAYEDAYILDADGQIKPDTARRDQFHLLRLGLAFPAGNHLDLALDLDGIVLASNADDFDFQALRFIPDAASFHSATVSPSATWYPAGRARGHSLLFSYGLTHRQYWGKPVRHAGGAYTLGAQADLEQALLLKGAVALRFLPGLSLFALGAANYAVSNQEFQALVRTHYELYTGQLGLEYRL